MNRLKDLCGGKTAGNGITDKHVTAVCPSIGGGNQVALRMSLKPFRGFF